LGRIKGTGTAKDHPTFIDKNCVNFIIKGTTYLSKIIIN
jgi:hypothetical protein